MPSLPPTAISIKRALVMKFRSSDVYTYIVSHVVNTHRYGITTHVFGCHTTFNQSSISLHAIAICFITYIWIAGWEKLSVCGAYVCLTRWKIVNWILIILWPCDLSDTIIKRSVYINDIGNLPKNEPQRSWKVLATIIIYSTLWQPKSHLPYSLNVWKNANYISLVTRNNSIWQLKASTRFAV